MRGVKRVAGGLLVVLLVGAALAWWQRESLQTWWVVRGLKQADESTRSTWAARLASLGGAAESALVEGLRGEDERECSNLQVGLDCLARAGHAESLAQRLAADFGRYAPTTQAKILQQVAGWCEATTPTPGFNAACARLIVEASGCAAEVQSSAVDLAGRLLQQAGDETTLAGARELTGAALRASVAETRLKGIRLALQPGVEMLEQVVGLLRDPSVEVRRGAILALGPAEQAAREDLLLPGLHDADAEVRRLTEVALRGRGLRPEHLELGRLLTHPQPTARLEILDRIRDMLDENQSSDLDPGAWLRRLSHDHSPAVRAAALRLMSQQSVVDLTDRIDQMARSDPSPTVSQLAAYYRKGKIAPAPER